MVTLDERTSKLRLAFPLNSKHKAGVSVAISRLLKPIKNFVHSMTNDNGKEFAGHEDVKIAVNKLKSRPRKCLGFKTPYQVFFKMTGVEASQLEVVRL